LQEKGLSEMQNEDRQKGEDLTAEYAEKRTQKMSLCFSSVLAFARVFGVFRG
jgi:hypothetical protein